MNNTQDYWNVISSRCWGISLRSLEKVSTKCSTEETSNLDQTEAANIGQFSMTFENILVKSSVVIAFIIATAAVIFDYYLIQMPQFSL